MKLLAILLLSITAIVFVQCSSQDEEIEIRRKPTESKNPDPGAADWDNLKATVVAECGKCHNGTTHPKVFDTLAKFKVPAVKARISNDTMPPGGGLSEDVKADLLSVW